MDFVGRHRRQGAWLGERGRGAEGMWRPEIGQEGEEGVREGEGASPYHDEGHGRRTCNKGR